MKLKSQIILLLIAAMTPLLFSCEEDKEEYVHPIFGKMTQEPNPAAPGEMVTLTASQQQKGNGIAGVTYTWTVKELVLVDGVLKDTVFTERTNYDGYGKADPVLKFRVPSSCIAGSYKVQLRAEYSGYIGNNLWDEGSTWGTLIIQ